MAIDKLKRHKSPVIDHIPAELIKAGGRTVHCEVHKLICSVWNMEELPYVRIIVSIYKKGDKTDCIGAYHFCQPRTEFYPTSYCQG